MALKFGTSGVRGLVTDMTDRECFLYSRAFARYLKTRIPGVRATALAGDLRASTPRIMRAVAQALRAEDLEVDHVGFVPTPAVTLHGIAAGIASIMVTGSHIPDDRNGIKFNMPWGEVLKSDEKEISARHEELAATDETPFAEDGSFPTDAGAALPEVNDAARAAYVARCVEFFGSGCLDGQRIVLYQHSSVSREIMLAILRSLGAETIPVDLSSVFVPVDTEAVEEPERLAAWVAEHEADALVTTDGDGDRPLIVAENGDVMRGDVLGILVAGILGADAVATPVSCNTALEASRLVKKVTRTRIGSPYVIEAMNAFVEDGAKTVVGYEANGGFLTATEITDPASGRTLSALPTRDAALPLLALLRAAAGRGTPISELRAELPPRYTASGLLRSFPNDQGKALTARIEQGGAERAAELFDRAFGEVATIDFTDGARMTFANGEIVHLRPSGNAPEFRCYTEAETEERAIANNERALEIVARLRE